MLAQGDMSEALSKEQNSSKCSGDDKPIESSTEAMPSLAPLMRTTTTVSDELPTMVS